MSDKRHRQSSDHMQQGGGLQPGQDYTDLYTTKPDSHGSGEIDPNGHMRNREHTRGNG